MAKLATRDRRLVKSVTNPMAVSSNVVSMAQSFPQPANLAFCYTRALGQKLWLLGIDVWIFGRPVDPDDSWWFGIRRGFNLPTATAEVTYWENVLPLLAPTGSWTWHGYGTPYHMHWDMRKFYEGQSQRFGACINITGPIVSYFQASFEISEG